MNEYGSYPTWLTFHHVVMIRYAVRGLQYFNLNILRSNEVNGSTSAKNLLIEFFCHKCSAHALTEFTKNDYGILQYFELTNGPCTDMYRCATMWLTFKISI